MTEQDAISTKPAAANKDISCKGTGKPSGSDTGCLAHSWAYVRALAVKHWFILGLGFAIGFAAAVPNLGKSGGWIRSEYSIKIPATVIIFILSGIGLKTKVLVTASSQLHVHALIQGVSLALLPLIGYGIARGLWSTGLLRPLVDGFVVLAAMPTTVSTNVVFTKQAGGNEAVALVNAVLGNIIGIFITPAWLTVFLSVQGAAPYSKVLTELAYLVIAPLVLGQVLQYIFTVQVAALKARVNTSDIGSVCILLLVWITYCATFASTGPKPDAGEIFAIIGLDVGLFLLALVLCFGLSWLFMALPRCVPPAVARPLAVSRADTVAVMIVGATKTVALGVPLITVMYGSTANVGLLTTPLIVYHALQIILGATMLERMRTWVEAAGGGGSAAAGAADSSTGQVHAHDTQPAVSQTADSSRECVEAEEGRLPAATVH